MLHCAIVGLSQEMNFETNTVVTYLVLTLPGGEQVRAAVDDGVAAHIVEQHVQANHPMTSVVRPPPAPAAPLAAVTGNDVEEGLAPEEDMTFFSSDIPQDDTAGFVVVSPPTPAPKSSPIPILTSDGEPYVPARNVPARTVPKDANGYPIVAGGMDLADLGTQGLEEDGVGSI